MRFLDEEDDGATYLASTPPTTVARSPRAVGDRRLPHLQATSFTGLAATNREMARFPRRINGRTRPLAHGDRQNNAISFSDDGHHWPEAAELQTPQAPWELIQLGKCGPPLETLRDGSC